VLEKVPFALLSLASAVVTFVAQQRGGAVVHQEVLPLAARVENAAIAYVTYVVKTLWPADLAIYYPHPAAGHPAWKVMAAGIALAVVSVLLLRGSRRYPYLATGWLWFVGTLVPVIGIVQVGGQAYADRYTYLPSIGLFIVLIWGGHDLLAAAWPRERMRWVAAPSIAAILVLGSVTSAQTAHWRDSRSVFGHALTVTSDNWMAHTNLGKAAFDEGHVDEAIDRFREALRLRPRSHVCLTNLGTALARGGNVRGAEQLFRGAIATEASDANAWYNLGVALLDQGRSSEAVVILQTAVGLVPGDGRCRKVLAAALLGVGQLGEASAQYREALRIDDHDVEATAGLGVALARGGHLDDAILAFRRAVSLDPHDPILRQNLETALAARAGQR
jgi:Flp pilus assembly protein TadD